MNIKPSIMRRILVAILVATLLLADSTPAYAAHRIRAGAENGGGKAVSCSQDPTCDPQIIEGVGTLNQKTLTVQDMRSAQPSLLEGKGASTNPADVVALVNNAITVWESAFDDASLPNLKVTVGWANFGVANQTHTDGVLAGSLVGGIKTANEDDSKALKKLGKSATTDFPSVEDEALALHICGAPGKPASSTCSEADRTEATILFNSDLLSIRQIDEAGQSKEVPIKFFLDTDPFDSAVFGSLEEIAASSDRVQQSSKLLSKLPDAYVVDLFTVALHEVGHAMGYSRVNQQVKGVPTSAHIGNTDMPDVLSPYAPFSTRKCPSVRDVTELAAVGSYMPGAQPYQLVSDNPCLVARADFHEGSLSQPNQGKSKKSKLGLGKLWKSIIKGIPIFSFRS